MIKKYKVFFRILIVMDATILIMRDLGVILFASFIGAAIFERLKLPPVLGMVLAGVILNPFTPGFVVENSQEIQIFAQLGGILLMFVLGLQFEYHLMRKIGPMGFILAAVASLVAFLAGAISGFFIGGSITELLILGTFFVSTSTTISLRLMQELGLDKLKNSKIMEAAIVIDDLYGFIVLSLISGYIGMVSTSTSDILLSSALMLSVLILVFIIGVKLIPKVFELFERYLPSSSLTLGTVFCLILIYVLMFFNISPFVGAFLAGTILTSSISHKNVLLTVMPIRNLFANVFFVSMGLLLDPNQLFLALPLVIFLSVMAVLSKWFAASAVLFKMGSKIQDALKLGVITAPRGEVLLIIAGNVVLAGVVAPVFLSMATGIMIFSAISPTFIIKIMNRFNI